MQLHGNTIFITGGTSGIGRGLAEAFHARGNQVIIAGRRKDRLKEICGLHTGMAHAVLDVASVESIHASARKIIREFPSLNCVINNAGIQRHVGFDAENALDDAGLREEVETNVLGPIRVSAAFLPHLAKQTNPVLMNVSSGLAFVPMARFPVYCATKAALHSWTMSLRHQIRSTGVKVIEIIPPWVATELGGPNKPQTLRGRGPMPLDEFIAETMKELETDVDEVTVGESRRLYEATSPENVKKVFGFMNG